ncbi:MAG: YhcH/YjgK/YiaL family protein [Opitutaceae bacterium]
MIIDTLENAGRYAALHPLFAAGFDYLRRFKPDTADGRHEIEGDSLFALVQTVQTGPAAEKRFEAHRRYIDIQYVAPGSEIMEYSALDDLRPTGTFDEQKDFGLFHDPASATRLLVDAGSFAIYYPQDGHKPCCSAGAPATVRKIVIKAAV